MPPGPIPLVGWVRDLPDPRDFPPTHPQVRNLLAPGRGRPARTPTPLLADLTDHFGPVQDLGGLAADTAAACAGLIGYFDRRVYGRTADPCWVFLFKTARALARQVGNTPTGFRVTLKALARFGLPPADLWPPEPTRWDDDPPGLPFGFARELADLLFVRLDPPGHTGAQVLADVRAFVGAGFPVAFGVTVFDGCEAGPEVPFPSEDGAPCGARAVTAVGYDDRRGVGSERGSLRVRGGWGPRWGDDGYGWLPYRYVTDQLATDFWTLLHPDWLAAGDFGRPV